MSLSILDQSGSYTKELYHKRPTKQLKTFNNLYAQYPKVAMSQFEWVTHSHVDGSVQTLSRGTKSTLNLHNQIQTLRNSYVVIDVPRLNGTGTNVAYDASLDTTDKAGSFTGMNYIRGAPFEMIDTLTFLCGKDRVLEIEGRQLYGLWIHSRESDDREKRMEANVPPSWTCEVPPWTVGDPERFMHEELIELASQEAQWIVPLVNLPWGRSKSNVLDVHRCGATELTVEIKWTNSLTNVIDQNHLTVTGTLPTLNDVRANLISYGYNQPDEIKDYYQYANASVPFFEIKTTSQLVKKDFSDGVTYKELEPFSATNVKGMTSGVMCYFVPDMATQTDVLYDKLPGKIGHYDPLMIGAGLPGKKDHRYNIKEATFTLNKNRVSVSGATTLDHVQSIHDWYSAHHRSPKVPMTIIKVSDEIFAPSPMQIFEPGFYDRPEYVMEMKTKDAGNVICMDVTHWYLDFLGENVGRKWR